MTIQCVQWKLDDNPISELLIIPPYSIMLNTQNHSNGEHTLSVVSADEANNIGSSSITVSFENSDIFLLFLEDDYNFLNDSIAVFSYIEDIPLFVEDYLSLKDFVSVASRKCLSLIDSMLLKDFINLRSKINLKLIDSNTNNWKDRLSYQVCYRWTSL